MAHAEIMRVELEWVRAHKPVTGGIMDWMYSGMWTTIQNRSKFIIRCEDRSSQSWPHLRKTVKEKRCSFWTMNPEHRLLCA